MIYGVLSELEELLRKGDFSLLLSKCSDVLRYDPNNSEFLGYKFTALCGLEKEYEDIGFLRKYCWYRSTDYKGFEKLSHCYWNKGEKYDALVSMAFALSVSKNNSLLRSQLHEMLNELDYLSLKIVFLSEHRVGHLCLEPDSWLRKKSLGETDENCLYLFISNSSPANSFFYETLKKKIDVLENSYWYKLFQSRATLLDKEFYEAMPFDLQSCKRNIHNTKESLKELSRIYRSSSCQFSISDADIKLGWSLLNRSGIKKGDKIVCFHVRDSTYLKETISDMDNSHHDYRDMSISNYNDAINYLLNEGYHVIRIGVVSDQDLDINSSNYHDFCINRDPVHGDFLDVFIVSQCFFYLGTSSGPISFPACFDKPILAVNVAPFEPFYSPKSHFIPKYYLDERKRKVSFWTLFEEFFLEINDKKVNVMDFKDCKHFNDVGISLMENTKEDILGSVIEFEKKVVLGDIDTSLTNLQLFYMDRIPDSYWFKDFSCVLTDSFIRRNIDLLS